MTITIKTENQELFDNLLWLLENFKDDIEISTDKSKKDFIERMTKNPKSITKDFKFDREESNHRETKWKKVANEMRGTMRKETVEYLKKCSDEIRK